MMVDEEKHHQSIQYLCFMDILKSIGLIRFKDEYNVLENESKMIGIVQENSNHHNNILIDEYDSYDSNVDSFRGSGGEFKLDISFKESLIIDDDYLNYDNSNNFNNGNNINYNYLIHNYQEIDDDDDMIKNNKTGHDDDDDIDTDDDDDDDHDNSNNDNKKTDNETKNDITASNDNTSYSNDTNHRYIIRPDGWIRKIWELLGLVLLLWQLYDVVTGRYHHWLVHPIMDAYFILDIILRFRTGYIDHTGRVITNPEKIRRRYLKGSFLIDLIISLPYGFLSNIWKNRPITKLVEIKSRFHQKPKQNILLNFIFNRPFRLEVIHTIKDHLFERKYYKAFREATGIGIPVMPDRQKKPIQWIIRRTARILGFGVRIAETFKIVAYYSVIAKHIQGVAFSARSIIVLWPMLREKVRPVLLWKKLKKRLSDSKLKSD